MVTLVREDGGRPQVNCLRGFAAAQFLLANLRLTLAPHRQAQGSLDPARDATAPGSPIGQDAAAVRAHRTHLREQVRSRKSLRGHAGLIPIGAPLGANPPRTGPATAEGGNGLGAG